MEEKFTRKIHIRRRKAVTAILMSDRIYIVEGRSRKFLQWIQVAASTHLFKPGVA